MSVKSKISFFAVLLSLIANVQSSRAEVREAISMREIVPLIQQDAVVVFDLDNTVIEAQQMLGSDQFFEYLVAKAKTLGLKDDDAVAWALKNATEVQPVTSVRAVEAMTPKLIKDLQKQGVRTLALTARPIEWSEQTIRQVDSVGVDFTQSSLYVGDRNFGPDGRGINLKGVLFMPKGGDKGIYLKSYLADFGVYSGNLIFIDDKIRNVQSVDRAFNGSPFTHLEFRYGAADERVNAFDSKVAELQWKYFRKFGVFLTDAEAREMLKERVPVLAGVLQVQ